MLLQLGYLHKRLQLDATEVYGDPEHVLIWKVV